MNITKISLPVVSTDRTCGHCTACCLSKGVLELGKEGGQDCEHRQPSQGEQIGGCRIYSDRPHSCKVYTCQWLQGKLPDNYRPDKSGFVFDLDREKSKGYMFHCVTEAWPGAFKDPVVLYKIKKVCKTLKHPIIVNGHSMFVPNTPGWRKTVQETYGKDLVITLV